MKDSIKKTLILICILLSTTLNAQSETITSKSEEALKLYYEGKKYQNNFQPIKAQPLFKKALELDPMFIMAQYELANTYGQPKFRSDAYQKLLAMLPNATLTKYEKIFFDGLSAGFNGDRETSQAKMFELAEKYPKDPFALSRIAGFYNGQGETEKAIKVYEEIIAIDPDYTPIYISLGYIYRGIGNFDDSERIFKKAIELSPDNPNAYDSYAELLLKLGRYDESIEMYEKALTIEKIFPSAAIGIASNYLHKKEYNKALQRLDKIYDIAPTDNIKGGVHWAKSVIYFDQDDLKSAISELQKNLNFSQKNEDYASMGNDYFNMSRLYLLKGDYKNARKYITLSYENNDKVTQEKFKENLINNYKYDYAKLSIKEGNLTEGKKLLLEYEGHVKAQGNNRFQVQNIHELKALIAFAENNYDAVLTEIEQTNIWNYQNMMIKASTLEKIGRYKEAKEIYNHIATSRGGLNFYYSAFRHIALKKIASL